jgi:hypothetical protein
MSESDPQGTPAPAATPAEPVAAPPVAPSSSSKLDLTSEQLGERLARAAESAQRKLLADLGVDDLAKAKAALDAAKASEEANKSAEQRALESASAAKSAQAEADRLRAIATEHAARMLGVLSAEQQSAVKAIAGDDPAAQLRAIGALGPTWVKQASADAPPPPATTAPAPNAPAPTTAGSPPDHRAVYAALNPFERAAYGMSNPQVYDPKS